MQSDVSFYGRFGMETQRRYKRKRSSDPFSRTSEAANQGIPAPAKAG